MNNRILTVSSLLVLFNVVGSVPTLAHSSRSLSAGSAQVGDHYIPGHYVEGGYARPFHVDGYTRRDGRYVQGHDVQGGYREGHFTEGHWAHSRRRRF